MTWGALFDRAPEDVTVADVREALAERRADGTDDSAAEGAE